MQLRAEQLSSSLERQGLSPVYIISGDEPLQLMECADLVRQHARKDQFEERVVLEVESGFDWNSLFAESANVSLFSSRKLIELRLNNKPGKEGGAVLAEYATQPEIENVLLVLCGKVDKQTQKSKWYSALEKAGVAIQVWPIDARQLPGWIKQRFKQAGKTIDHIAVEQIAERVEGNLLAARQEIDKLCLLIDHENISMDDVNRAVSDSARYDVFELLTCALNADTERTVRILNGLRSELSDPAAIYGALAWDYRRLCVIAHDVNSGKPFEKACIEQRVWNDLRKSAIKRALPRLPETKLHQLLRYLIIIDRKIKSTDRDIVWIMLQSFLLSLTGKATDTTGFVIN